MKIDDINVNDTLEKAEKALQEEKSLSPSAKAIFSVLLLVVKLLMNRLGLNSSNSSKSPSSDPNRDKKPKPNTSGNKPGGQKGHKGTNLQPIANPDEIKVLKLDKKALPKGEYGEAGYSTRQVINFRISRHVIEYRAQILENAQGKKFTAEFPSHVTRPVQYGEELKAHAVYLSQFQLIPYNRIEDYFVESIKLPVRASSIFNFNKEAYVLLEKFETFVKQKLIDSTVLNADETGINVNAKKIWLHVAANEQWTHFSPHKIRGSEAMTDIGIVPNFKGTLCHDHWKAYYIFGCLHSLCNAHHIRELERAFEQDNQQWAFSMKTLLLAMNNDMKKAGDKLPEEIIHAYYVQYKAVIAAGDVECPCPEKPVPIDGKKKRGKMKKSKSRNLLERLSNFEEDTLRFMEDVDVPFTNNLAERNLRMTKVHQKISGCFRSMEGAYIFCRVRSYISTCRKQGLAIPEALNMLFRGEMPAFMNA
ncbi:MAG: IS66 family transposase [Bacteroidia bacterium]